MNYRIIAIALLATQLGSIVAASDCRRSPAGFAKNLDQCCRRPKPNLSAYSRECPNIAERFRTSELDKVDCLFKAADILNGEQLKLDNTRKMLKKLYPNDPEFATAALVSFEKCQSVVKARLAKIPKRRPTISAPQPSAVTRNMILIGYITCAGHELPLNCPPKLWISSNECEITRDYLTNCQSIMGGNRHFIGR
ncbi:uncharacterized protein LOC105230710 [Bactrocera dorsalis]|uniref:Uncharacterized protein LOC105230710 n=1 Tax=Bactrocera dorsalis TaxID=27457 RepID=A0A6I9VI00_BACDO|nr:uncharacterized protein LOC105230710 [Bactrocera dorsalis]